MRRKRGTNFKKESGKNKSEEISGRVKGNDKKRQHRERDRNKTRERRSKRKQSKDEGQR